RIPPKFAFDLTTTAPTIANAEKTNADQPSPVIELEPLSLNAASTPPTNNAKIAAKNPIIPPMRPSTNSVVRFIVTHSPLLLFNGYFINKGIHIFAHPSKAKKITPCIQITRINSIACIASEFKNLLQLWNNIPGTLKMRKKLDLYPVL